MGGGGTANFLSPEILAERPKNDRPLNQSYQPISVFETKMNHQLSAYCPTCRKPCVCWIYQRIKSISINRFSNLPPMKSSAAHCFIIAKEAKRQTTGKLLIRCYCVMGYSIEDHILSDSSYRVFLMYRPKRIDHQ